MGDFQFGLNNSLLSLQAFSPQKYSFSSYESSVDADVKHMVSCKFREQPKSLYMTTLVLCTGYEIYRSVYVPATLDC